MPRYSLRTLILLTILGLAVVAVIPYFVTGYHDLYTCLLCRANRIDYIYLDHTWKSTCTETACTRWYHDNIEPTHEHVWVQSRASALRNLYGQRFGAIDRNPVGRAIWSLTPEDQIAIYEHLPSTERKDMFLRLIAPSTMADGRDYQILRSLQDWKEGGFKVPGPTAVP